MLKRLVFIIGACLSAGALAACAVHGSSPLPDGSAGAANSAASKRADRVKVTMHLVIAGSPQRRRHRGRGAKFVSASTNGIMIQVYPHGAAQTAQNLIASAAVDVSSGSPACGGQTGSVRTCTAGVKLPVTKTNGDDFVLATYDAAPVSGNFTTANLLGAGSLADQQIAAGRANAIVVFIGGAIASLTGNPASASLPGDGSQHSMGIVIDPEDFGNNPIKAGSGDPFANPIVVSAVETGGTGHVKFSLNGATPAPQVTVTHSTDSVQLVYDGGGAVGYSATVSLNAPAIRGAAGASESIMLSPLFLASSNADYTAPKLALNGNGDELTMSISESGAPPHTAYTATGTSCSAIADNDKVQGFGESASFDVYARGTISTPPPGAGCVIAVSDGTSTVNVAVSNAYSGTLGSPSITEYSTAVSDENPNNITVGPDGAMWFAESGAASFGRIPATGTSPVATDVALPTTNGTPQPEGIAAGPDGNLWWADCGGTSTVGNVTTAGVGTSYTTQSNAYPKNIVQGPDGAMWFTECGASSIGRITTEGVMTPAIPSLTANSYPVGIVVGSDGNLWFTECNANKIGKITPAGALTEISLPNSPGGPYGITAGPDGALWFVEIGGNKVGRIPTTGTQSTDITEYSTGITGSSLRYITTGPDGALWFTEHTKSASGLLKNDSVIGRLDPQSSGITEYAVQTANSSPTGITAGPDGAIWFTECSASNIGRIAIQTSATTRHRLPRHPERSEQSERGRRV
jgi:streptogramin lyase